MEEDWSQRMKERIRGGAERTVHSLFSPHSSEPFNGTKQPGDLTDKVEICTIGFLTTNDLELDWLRLVELCRIGANKGGGIGQRLCCGNGEEVA